MKIVKSVCRLCKADCGILVHVDSRGRAVKVEGDPESPPNRGALCSKGNALLQLVYDPDRVTRPVRRRGDGGWEEVSWPQALDEIAARLSAIGERYGGTALATYEGSSFTRANTQAYVRRFLHYFGSPNRTGTESLCVTPKYVAAEATLGRGLLPVGDFRRARAIFLFGANPAFTSMHRYLRITEDILAAKERGATLVVVDPVFTATAAKADLWVPIKPGTDLALILAMIRVIVEEGLYDAEYVCRHTSGFDSLR
ncbi:MAG: molybdopterin-containing oxidoreductase family protein, partial [Desulfotomaculales bacterium]